eukprot:gene12729-gene13631
MKGELPKQFVIIFDGWTCDFTHTHFVAVLAVYSTVPYREKVLLSLAHLLDEADYSAESHAKYISSILQSCDRDVSNVLFVAGDTCSTN